MQRGRWRRRVAPILMLALLAPSVWARPAGPAGMDLAGWLLGVCGWGARLWAKVGWSGLPPGSPTRGEAAELPYEGEGWDPWG